MSIANIQVPNNLIIYARQFIQNPNPTPGPLHPAIFDDGITTTPGSNINMTISAAGNIQLSKETFVNGRMDCCDIIPQANSAFVLGNNSSHFLSADIDTVFSPSITTRSGDLILDASGSGVVRANKNFLTASRIVSTNTDNAVSKTTGSIVTAGGMGIGGDVFYGGFLFPPLGNSGINIFERSGGTIQFSGIWATPIDVPMTFMKIGMQPDIVQVTIMFNNYFIDTATISDVIFGQIDGSYAPLTTMSYPIQIRDNGTYKFGTLTIASDGSITIYNGTYGIAFTGSGDSGMPIPTSFSYLIAP